MLGDRVLADFGSAAGEGPRVSVVIANYNSARYLEDAVRSAMGQTVADIEILIADDVSSDDSPAIAQRLAMEDARVRFIPAQRNTGPAGARNRALAAARGGWIAVLDSDDLMHPSRLERLLRAADDLGADMVADDLVVFDDAVTGKVARFLQSPENAGAFELTPRRYCAQTVMYGAKPNLGFLKPMIRRAAMQAASLRYDERLRIAEDDDLILRALAGGLRYWVVPQLTYFYRKHAQSISHRSNVADLLAMAQASDRIAGLFPGAAPATRRAIARRAAATHDALAFEHVVDALRERRVAAALAGLLRRPSAAWLLRLPLGARLRPKPRPVPLADEERHVLFVSSQQDHGSAEHLPDMAAAIRAAGMVPHLLQPVTSHRPVMRLGRAFGVFETHRVRGGLKLGRFILSLDRRVWGEALRAWLPGHAPLPPVAAPRWSDGDRLFVAQYGRRHADAVLVDEALQSEVIAMLMRPEVPCAALPHGLAALAHGLAALAPERGHGSLARWLAATGTQTA